MITRPVHADVGPLMPFCQSLWLGYRSYTGLCHTNSPSESVLSYSQRLLSGTTTRVVHCSDRYSPRDVRTTSWVVFANLVLDRCDVDTGSEEQISPDLYDPSDKVHSVASSNLGRHWVLILALRLVTEFSFSRRLSE